MSTASPNLQLSTAIITHCSSGCSSTKYFPQCVNTAYFSSSMKTGLEPEPTPLNPHYTTSLTRSKFEPPPELSCSYLQMQEQLSNPAHASAPATHPHAGSAHICLLGAAALSCRQHPGGSGTHARPVAAAAFVPHALSNPIRNTGQEESSSTRRTQKQAAGSRLPASRQHHLGAERDCIIPAHSPTGRLLSFFQENHTSRVHCILSSCRPPPSHRHHLPSPGWRTVPPSCTGVQGTLQHVAVSYCKALLLSPPPSSGHCTAVLHFPLHLSFPFPGCAVLGSQLCSQGTPQSSKDQEGHSALACSQHCCSENITREQSGPALKFPCGCGKHQHSISQYNAMLLYRLMLPVIRDTAAVLGH